LPAQGKASVAPTHEHRPAFPRAGGSDPLPLLSVVYSFLGRYALYETLGLRINASAATASYWENN